MDDPLLSDHLKNNNLLNSNQSGFRPVNSCVHEPISITRDVYKTFDANLTFEVRGVFLDLSKVFNKVWHESILWICEKYFRIIDSYLCDRCQRVCLNCQISKWPQIKAGVPQG